MDNGKKTLENMNVLDDFLMSQLAADAEYGEAFCRRLLSSLLSRKIGKLKVNAQKVFPGLLPSLRGIRLDVEVEETEETEGSAPAVMNLYDIEPHLRNDMDLPRHNRFYQARIDGKGLQSGEKDFTRLPNLYVLTVTDFDPFGEDQMVYTVHNMCEEVPGLAYEDGLRYYYFYTDGQKGGNEELRTVLRYMKDSRAENAVDAATRELHGYVEKVKIRPEVRVTYMRLDEIIYYERKDAAKEAAKAVQIRSILDLLEDLGEIPSSVLERFQAETDAEILKRWHKLAAKVGSIEEFIQKMDVSDR